MPSNSTGRFLTAPVRAVRSFKKHLYSIFCQKPIKRPPGPLKPLGLLGPSGPSGLLVQSIQLIQLK